MADLDVPALLSFLAPDGEVKPAETWSRTEHYFDPDLGMWMVHHTDSDGTDVTYPQE